MLQEPKKSPTDEYRTSYLMTMINKINKNSLVEDKKEEKENINNNDILKYVRSLE